MRKESLIAKISIQELLSNFQLHLLGEMALQLSRKKTACGGRHWMVPRATVVVIGLSTLLQIARSQSTPPTLVHPTGSSHNISDTARLDGLSVRLVPKIFAEDFPNYALAINGSHVTLTGRSQGQKAVYTNCKNNTSCMWKIRREVILDNGSDCAQSGQGKEVFMFGNVACPGLYMRWTRTREDSHERHARLVASGIWGKGPKRAGAFFSVIPACRSGNKSYHVIFHRHRHSSIKGFLAVNEPSLESTPAVTTIENSTFKNLTFSKDADCANLKKSSRRLEYALFQLDAVRSCR